MDLKGDAYFLDLVWAFWDGLFYLVAKLDLLVCFSGETSRILVLFLSVGDCAKVERLLSSGFCY